MNLASPEIWISLLTLSTLEIVLGIDNLVFLSILAGRLPKAQQAKARKLGLVGAFVSRLGLLSGIAWIVKLDQPLFEVLGVSFSGKALILLAGGLFLLYKATHEIHQKIEGDEQLPQVGGKGRATLSKTVIQITIIDIVFSIDSVITAVGLSQQISVMIAANVIALLTMTLAVNSISDFIDRHPTVKVLALSFLIMIGAVLVAEGVGFHIPHGYVYFAMAFSVMVETINIKVAEKSKQAKKR